MSSMLRIGVICFSAAIGVVTAVYLAQSPVDLHRHLTVKPLAEQQETEGISADPLREVPMAESANNGAADRSIAPRMLEQGPGVYDQAPTVYYQPAIALSDSPSSHSDRTSDFGDASGVMTPCSETARNKAACGESPFCQQPCSPDESCKFPCQGDSAQPNGDFAESDVRGSIYQNVPETTDQSVQDRAVQDRAVQDRAVQDWAVQDRAVQDWAVQDRAVQEMVLRQHNNDKLIATMTLRVGNSEDAATGAYVLVDEIDVLSDSPSMDAGPQPTTQHTQSDADSKQATQQPQADAGADVSVTGPESTATADIRRIPRVTSVAIPNAVKATLTASEEIMLVTHVVDTGLPDPNLTKPSAKSDNTWQSVTDPTAINDEATTTTGQSEMERLNQTVSAANDLISPIENRHGG
jgi:hypothetical protein